ncbi:MAG: hypothetical protein HY751_09590 [Nitrospinae bacterium]|nr:hypothetical protein [Nitrospinota bacterium]
MSFRYLARTALIIAVLGLALSEPASAQRDDHGRFAIGHINIDDTASAGDFSATTLFYRYIADNFMGWENLSFNLDGNTRFSNQDYNHDIPGGRVSMANVKLKKLMGHVDLTLGRSFVEEFVSESVDGVDVKYWLDNKTGAGVFGGLRPDPYKDSVNADYNTVGGYLFTRTDELGLSAGYAYDTYKGKKDRERINGVFYIMPSIENLHFQMSADVDNIDEEADEEHPAKQGWEVTNLLAHFNWRPVRRLVLSATYNEFRAINREASHLEQRIEMLEDKYTVARVRAEGSLGKSFYIYGGVDQRFREADSANATQLYAGLRDSDFVLGTRWDLRYSDLDYFTSKVKAVYGMLGVTVGESFNVEGSATWLKNTQEGQMGDLEQWVYDVTLDYWITKNIYANLMWQYSSEKYLDINSIYATRFADNFTTTTLYGQVGYRF